MRVIIGRIILLAVILLLCSGLLNPQDISAENQVRSKKVSVSDIIIINSFPHNSKSFTQGLVYYKGYLYESTGINGNSSLKKIDIKSGKAIKEIKLGEKYFGEGITILNNKIYQLTWKNRTCFIYDLHTFLEIGKFFYSGEGWGLTTDGKSLLMSDGSSAIVFINPDTLQITKKIHIQDDKIPVTNLNELEYIGGEIWANIYMQDIIARISPDTGEVLGWIDLKRLYKNVSGRDKMDVLNGIAYDCKGDRIFITGKYWPKLFEIKIQNPGQD